MSGLSSIWPWLVVAGAGALHGLNPCTGWALAAACGARDPHAWWRALGPLALGHAASVGAVATLVALGLAMEQLPWLAGAGLVACGLWVLSRRPRPARTGLALWSFSMATVHGSGLMLLPALLPLCLSTSPAREITASGSLGLALAAVAVHMATMLAVTAAAAWLACRGLGACRAARPTIARPAHRPLPHHDHATSPAPPQRRTHPQRSAAA